MKKFSFFCLLPCLLFSGCKQSTLQEIDLKRLVDLELVVFHEPASDFSDFGAIFLEQTEGAQYRDVKQLILLEDKIYLLYANNLHSFDFGSGTRNPLFAPEDENWDIVDFDIDTLQQYIYAIDRKQQRLLCLDTRGQMQFEMALSSEHEYFHVRVLDPEHLLLTVNSMPVAVTQIVNLPQRSFQTLDHPVSKSFTLNTEQIASLRGRAPLFLLSRSGEGILAKYIFNDTIFRYTAQGKEAVFYTAMNSRKLQWKEGPDLYKDNNQAALCGIWRVAEDQWLCRVGSYYNKGGRKVFTFVLCDTLMTPYEKTNLRPPEAFVSWESLKSHQYFWINAATKLFVDEDKRIFFTVVMYDPEKKVPAGEGVGKIMKLPANLLTHPNKKELMLCYYKLKDGPVGKRH
jgi:hypothetical protein